MPWMSDPSGSSDGAKKRAARCGTTDGTGGPLKPSVGLSGGSLLRLAEQEKSMLQHDYVPVNVKPKTAPGAPRLAVFETGDLLTRGHRQAAPPLRL